jgi:hypothetical protein
MAKAIYVERVKVIMGGPIANTDAVRQTTIKASRHSKTIFGVLSNNVPIPSRAQTVAGSGRKLKVKRAMESSVFKRNFN